MKRRTIITSVLVIVLCLGLISGSTFALFTSESSVNIAVTSGKVNVVATLKDLAVYSATANTVGLSDAERDDEAGTLTGTFAGTYYYKVMPVENNTKGTFANGGTAKLGDPANVLTIDKITPGDKVKVNVDVKNNSNVAIQYRVRVNVLEGDDAAASYKLFKGLKVDIGETPAATDNQLNSTIRVSEWTPLAAETEIDDDIPVEIYLPLEAGNEYQGLTTKLLLTVEAVQGNANTSTLAGINAKLKASAQKNATMYDAIQELTAHSYSYDDLKGYVWSADNDLFYAESDVESSFEYRFFKVYTEMPSEQTFSIYADPTWNRAVVNNLTVGFDAGEATGITTVTYDRSTATTEQDVVIRTNSTQTTVTINAPKDVVKHYGTAGTLSIVAVAGSSYHEYGVVGFLDISTGHIALEKTSEVSKLHFNATQESSDKVFKEIVVSYDKSLSNKLPEFSRDQVEIPEGGKLVVELQKVDNTQEETKTTSDFIWLTKQGIFEQIKVSDNNESLEDAKWADDDDNVDDDTQLAAQQIANNIGRNDTSNQVEETVNISGTNYTVTLNETTRELEVVNTDLPTEPVTTEVTTNAIAEAVKETGLTNAQKEEAISEIKDAVARIGINYYDSLQNAIDAAKAGDVVDLLKNVTLSTALTVDSVTKYAVGIEKSITINGNNKTITALTERGVGVKGQTNNAIDVTLNDLTIICSSMYGAQGIMTRDNVKSLNLNNVVIDNRAATSGYVQAITVSGTELSTKRTLNINNSKVLNLENVGYTIITWAKCEINVDKSEITGWSPLYFKPNTGGSSATIRNSKLTSVGVEGSSNSFGLINFENGSTGNTVVIENTDISVSTTATISKQSLVSFSAWYGPNESSTVTITGGSIKLTGNNALFVIDNGSENSLTITSSDIDNNGEKSTSYSYSSPNLENVVAYMYKENEAELCVGFYEFNNFIALSNQHAPNYIFCDGEWLVFYSDSVLTENAELKVRNGGTFGLVFGDYTLTSTDKKLTIPVGVTIKTDKAIDSLLTAPENATVVRTELTGDSKYNYSYTLKISEGYYVNNNEIVQCTEHVWNDGIITKVATSEVEGEKTYTCTRCGAKKYDVVPKIEQTKIDITINSEMTYDEFKTAMDGHYAKVDDTLTISYISFLVSEEYDSNRFALFGDTAGKHFLSTLLDEYNGSEITVYNVVFNNCEFNFSVAATDAVQVARMNNQATKLNSLTFNNCTFKNSTGKTCVEISAFDYGANSVVDRHGFSTYNFNGCEFTGRSGIDVGTNGNNRQAADKINIIGCAFEMVGSNIGFCVRITNPNVLTYPETGAVITFKDNTIVSCGYVLAFHKSTNFTNLGEDDYKKVVSFEGTLLCENMDNICGESFVGIYGDETNENVTQAIAYYEKEFTDTYSSFKKAV